MLMVTGCLTQQRQSGAVSEAQDLLIVEVICVVNIGKNDTLLEYAPCTSEHRKSISTPLGDSRISN